MFIAKNNDLIILAKETREELEQALQFMVYTSIEKTEIEYELYDGEYLTKEEIEVKNKERKRQEILDELDKLDLKSIRAIRANDEEYIAQYEAQAQELRKQLQESEHRKLRITDIISIAVSVVTLTTVVSSVFFWFYKTDGLPARVENNEKRIDKLENQIIENNTKTDLIYQGVLEIRGVLLRK